MKRIEEKRGQFYLIAAVVIVGVIIGFATVYNYAGRGNLDKEKVYSLKDEFGFEGGEVIDYGIYKSSTLDLKELVTHFSGAYTKYSGENKELYVVFGDKTNTQFLSFKEVFTGSVSINPPGTTSASKIVITGKEKNIVTCGILVDTCKLNTPGGDTVIVKLSDETTRTFKLKKGENFYFIISAELGDDKVVVGNE